MQTAQHVMPVPFYEDTVVLVGKDNEPLVAMKPIVTNMGMDWKTQYRKLSEKFNSVMVEMTTTGGDGKQYDMVCLPLRKLPAWLYSISPNKVPTELRDKITRYQEECDDALWSYWTKGSAERAGAPNVNQQIALSRHRITLLKELNRTRNNALRAALHEQLDQTSRQLGLSTPALEAIGRAEPDVPDLVTEFWDLFYHLSAQPEGHKLNHAVAPGKLAINLNEVARAAQTQRCTMPHLSELRHALRLSQHPRFVEANKCSHSAHARNEEGKAQSIRCWIFTVEQAAD
ncbi:phage antirepressor N-terminal domain-containing protein [Pseudomonas protegens]|uniref:phage antirepressor N-terminal domain-containing protein n=1 Tax=Pseudomonas protegens TaxID=380021 RepID=UPI002936DF3D|nr:phage antirepressor N-terminal domain-containing protein [Pseudomonas protegens]WOE81653.1 phage antirepressor N-terminal domain-containing protein [Pseudomonas protegens]